MWGAVTVEEINRKIIKMAAANNKSHDVIKLHKSTAYDWEAERNKYKDIQDDGTMSFFW